MKLVLLVVSVIAVFTADSRDIPVKPEDEILTEQSLGRDLHQELNNGSVLITDEPQGFNFTGVLPPFPGFNFTGVHPPFTEEGEGLHEETNRAIGCTDKYTDCSSSWLEAGFCSGYIFNKHSTYFEQWMSTNCPITCKTCATTCPDKWNPTYHGCSYWANKGICSLDHYWGPWMAANCTKSCGTCIAK